MSKTVQLDSQQTKVWDQLQAAKSSLNRAQGRKDDLQEKWDEIVDGHGLVQLADGRLVAKTSTERRGYKVKPQTIEMWGLVKQDEQNDAA